MKPEKPLLRPQDPAAKPRSHSSKLLLLVAVIVFGVLAYMIFHMAVTPHPPDSDSPMEPKKTLH